MSRKTGDEFNAPTRKVLAERVGWKCSFPGCGTSTIGPKSDDPAKSINNGIAAHIHGARPGSARYKSTMTQAQRRHISNGIWMCRSCANLIDADNAPYSPETLHAWKRQAENRAADRLKTPAAELLPEESTLLQLGSGIVFHATWERVNQNTWSFGLIRPEIGDVTKLKEFVLSRNLLPESETYVVVESEGDARRLNDASLGKSESGQLMLEVDVQDKLPATDPNRYGSSLKIGETGDLVVEDGDLAMVRGIEAAKQRIMCTMGVVKGELYGSAEIGSMVSCYFHKFGDDLELLSRLTKLELIRLSLIPVASGFGKDERKPPFDFVKRFVSATVSSRHLSHSRLLVSVEVEWGNGEYWSGDLRIFVSHDST